MTLPTHYDPEVDVSVDDDPMGACGCWMVGLVAAAGLAWLSWPIGILLVISAGAWLLLWTKSEKGLVCRLAAQHFAAITVSLAIVSLAQIYLRVSGLRGAREKISDFKENCMDLKLAVQNFSPWIPVLLISLLLIAVLASLVLPQLKLLVHYSRLSRLVHYGSVVVAVITSFTFGSLVVADQGAKRAHSENKTILGMNEFNYEDIQSRQDSKTALIIVYKSISSVAEQLNLELVSNLVFGFSGGNPVFSYSINESNVSNDISQ